MTGVNKSILGEVKALRHSYEVEILSIPQIASKFGMTRSTVRKWLIDDGVKLRTRREGHQLRKAACGLAFRGKKRAPFSEKHRKAISRSRLKFADKHAKGTSNTHGGHLRHTRGPHKDRAVHIVIMEKRIGRKLRRDEIVHHIDESKQDNSDDNLALMTRAGHTKWHRYLQKLKREARRDRS